MAVPISQMWTVATYVLKQKLKGRKQYPLVLMLEPLFRCNLACAGCGKIDYPDAILNQRLTVEQCLEAVDECGAPVVSIAGGEPLLHREIEQVVDGIIARKKFVYLCTNALLMEKKLDRFKPSPFFVWSVHLDGDKEMHDHSVCEDGVYERAMAAIKTAKAAGFRVNINCTLFDGAQPERVAKFFDDVMAMGVDGIMTAHLYLPAIEPRQDLPATLSHTVLTGLLRDTLNYQGLILTDALDMQAIKKDRTAAEAAVEAFQAGADLLLIAGVTEDDRAHLGEGPPALLAAVQSGRVSEARLDQSVLRILAAKARRGVLAGAVLPPVVPEASVLNSPAHRALALEVARKAVTLQRDSRGLLPMSSAAKVLVVEAPAPTRSLAVDDALASTLLEAVKQFTPSAVGAPSQTAVETARSANAIVLGTFDLAQSPAQQKLAADLAATGKPVVAVSLRGPYDAAVATEIGTWLAVYGDRPIHLQAAAEALFGRLTPTVQVP